jgi:hypothetical protein
MRKIYNNEYSIEFDKKHNRHELWKKDNKGFYKFVQYLETETQVKDFIKKLTSKDKYIVKRSNEL